MLSCRFSQLGFYSGKPELYRRPYFRALRIDLPLTKRTPCCLLVQPSTVISTSAQSPFHRSEAESGRAVVTADGGSTQSAQLGASGSAKGRSKRSPPGVSLRLQSVAPTESPYSKHNLLGRCSSRCSHDLCPLRGLPAQPLGFRPPLMCLLRLGPPRLATL